MNILFIPTPDKQAGTQYLIHKISIMSPFYYSLFVPT
jgi:hypothetical protein